MTEITREEQYMKLLTYKKGFCAFYLIKTGLDLGFFEKFNASEDVISPKTLADKLGLHEPYVRIWCQTAYYMEILDCHGDDRFSLAPHMGTLLADTSTPSYYGHWIRFMTTYYRKALESHPQYYRSGLSEFYDDHDQGFSKGIKALSDQVIPICYMSEVIPSIPGLEEGMAAGMRILDIGCGSGLLMIELAKAFPNCIFVGVDVDKFAIKDAHRRIKENSVEDRVCAHLIDAVSIDYDGEFDLVNLAVTLHEINPKIRDRSIANCFRALKDSGQIVILESDYPEGLEDFRKLEYTYVILEQFIELTFGCKFLSRAAKHQLLLEHGFKEPTTISMPGDGLKITYASKRL